MSLSGAGELNARGVQTLPAMDSSTKNNESEVKVFNRSAELNRDPETELKREGMPPASDSVSEVELNKRRTSLEDGSPQLQESAQDSSDTSGDAGAEDGRIEAPVRPDHKAEKTEVVSFKELSSSIKSMLLLLNASDYRCTPENFSISTLVRCMQKLDGPAFLQLIKLNLMSIGLGPFHDEDVINLIGSVRALVLDNKASWGDVKPSLARLYGEILYALRFAGDPNGYHCEVCDVLMSLLKDFVDQDPQLADEIYVFLTKVSVQKSEKGLLKDTKITEMMRQVGSAMKDPDFRSEDRPQYAAGVLPILASYSRLLTHLSGKVSAKSQSSLEELSKLAAVKVQELEKSIGTSASVQRFGQRVDRESSALSQDKATPEDFRDAKSEVDKIRSQINARRWS
ncbi:hypothetical protein [Endozoicomonas sp.]|uniref:hypothetical protein n=1 Tax=Endozoicomonas sp. TaxID=1892382 RepID=UPI003AF560A7